MIGSTVGHYRIEAKLGEGGMGVVYRAVDTRLDRTVAIKMLRPDAAASPERKRRFTQEARSASALNHPGIVHVYDIGTADLPEGPADFIAMEFVPGKTLDQHIGSKGLPLKEALRFGVQIADALARAHAAGIVHRDLKPANVIVGDDGRVKVLDFGLAKLAERPTVDSDGVTRTTTPHTEEGVIVGTLSYMSPEQAEGRTVDSRSDIFSFGAVLYEMVTGRRAFQGGNSISTLAAILNKEPQPASEFVPVPAEFEKIVARCLRKDPERRAQAIADIKVGLEELLEGTTARPVVSPLRMGWVAAGIVLLIAGLVSWWMWNRPQAAPSRSEWVQITNLPDSAVHPALSPDGRLLAFIRGPSSFVTQGQVYVKMLPSGDPVQLTRQERSKLFPVFSPDGSRIAYSMAGGIWDTWAVPVLGGEPRLFLPNASGLSWIGKSTLLFSEIKDQRFHMAIVTSDESRAGSRDIYVPPHERGMAHRAYASPDGKWMLVVEMSERGDLVRCRLSPLDGSSPGEQTGPPGGVCNAAAWSPDGAWMYFSSDFGGAFHIWRQQFPDGQPEQITSGPTTEEGIAMSPDGRSLITSVGLVQSSVWLHERGAERQISLEGHASAPRFTPDGKGLLYAVRKGAGSELWLADLASGLSQPLLPGFNLAWLGTNQSGYDISADGRHVVAVSMDDKGTPRLWISPLDRSSPPRQIPNVGGTQPLFGASGEVFFRRVEGDSAFLYRVQEDGSGLQKALDLPVVGLMGRSADYAWLGAGLGSTRGLLLLRTDGGEQVRTDLLSTKVAWSLDGKQLYIQKISDPQAYVFPLASGKLIPEAMRNRLPEAEVMKLPGVRSITASDIAPGPTAETYAFTRVSTQRNLYRIPLE